ncbi:hypothetical protein [Microvirga sp. 2TAF3]|uniref:hypothetical protein n=1 Tax=Microvirga sp. 2TAF3 TaxID=3233014 RepID=UPI003F94634F
MKWLSRLLGKHSAAPENASDEQAILIHLAGASLPDEIYEEYDLTRLEDRLTEALGSLGEHDGHESGPGVTIVYLYGPDAEAMFHAIEPVLKDHPLARGASVIIRKGAPGAPEREVRMPH